MKGKHKEFRIEVFCHDLDEEGEVIGFTPVNGHLYTDWVDVAVAYTNYKISRPEDRFRIVCRNVTDWDTCYY